MPRLKQFDEEEVLKKAVEIFWKQGFHGTSMEELVNYTGINRASLYDTFGGKRQFFEKAIHKYIDDNTTLLENFFQSQKSVKQGLSNFFDILIHESISDCDLKGCFVVNTSAVLIPSDPEMIEILKNNKINFERFFYEYLKKGQDSKEISISKDIKSISKFLVTLFNGLKLSSKINPDPKEMKAIVNVALSILED